MEEAEHSALPALDVKSHDEWAQRRTTLEAQVIDHFGSLERAYQEYRQWHLDDQEWLLIGALYTAVTVMGDDFDKVYQQPSETSRH